MKNSWGQGAAFAASLAALLVAACGGGVGSGGTGSAAQLAQGTVSGFGSVIVDGRRYDDRGIAAHREDEPGVERLSDVRLGDQVEVELDEQGVPSGLHVHTTLAGAVDALPAAGRFVVLGQTVQVNTDAATGPVTQFGGGYTGAGDITAGDAVEVHGVIVPEAGTSRVRATRIDRLAAPPAWLRASGLVSGLGANGFRIGALSVHTAQATIVPAGRTLRDGQLVTVFALPAGRSGSAAAPVLQAVQVRFRDAGAAGTRVTLGGNVAGLDAAAQRFQLGALTVHYAGATLSPPLLVLADGQYLRVGGTLRSDGSLQADTIALRDGRNEPESELKGNILGLDAATQRFSVRGVDVDASAADIERCPGGVLAEGLFVEVEGRLGPTGVVAREISCEDEPSGGTVGREGTVGSVDGAARRFVLTTRSGGTVTVAWTDNTLFDDIEPDALDGRRVEVEGVFDGAVLTARKVHGEE